MIRPSIGLALGSGAARGWSHIGILRALKDAGIEPDVICGTSIGALVGGLYLAERLDTLEDWARGLTKLRILRYLDFRAGTAGGFVSGLRLSALLERNIGELRIEQLARPFAAIATELTTGHEIWLRQGPLIEALRASYALPGVFTPVRIDEQWVVDGALVNPVPVSVCRAMGARLVIAADLGGDVIGKYWKGLERGPRPALGDPIAEAVAERAEVSRFSSILQAIRGNGSNGRSHNVFGVMMASLNIMQDRLARSRLAGDPPDVTIAPRIGHVGLLEFDRAAECIAEGRAAVERALPQLRDALSVLG